MDERIQARRTVVTAAWRPRHALAVVIALLIPAAAMASPLGTEKPIRLPAVSAPTTLSPQPAASAPDVPQVPESTAARPQSLFPTFSKVDLPEMKLPEAAAEAPAKAWNSISRQGKRTVIVMREWLPGSSAWVPRDGKQRKYFDGLVPNTDALFNAEPDYDVHLTSYQQSSGGEPEPPPLPPPAGDEGSGAPTEPPEEPIGQAPPDNRQVFLRSATVLLNPGDVQFDWGIEYQLFKTDAPVIVGGGILDEEEVRDRRLFIPFAARLGLTRRIQAFVQAPVGWAQAERVNSVGETTDETFGIADVSAGANIVLQEGRGYGPDVIGTLGFTAPTGDDPFGNQLTVASLGDGFWALNGSVLWIHTYDPVVVFYGLGYRHRFERAFNGAMIAPGEEVTYNCGVGLAINDRITFSTAFQGSYISETQVNGNAVSGSDLEPMSLRMALTAITSPCHIIEPFIRFGLTDDAADGDFGVVVTRSF